MIIRDTWQDPLVLGLPPVSDIMQRLLDPDPEVACKAVFDMHVMLDMIQRTQLPLLMTRQGMSIHKAAGILGRSDDYVRNRLGQSRDRRHG